jgi:hypothetical protein
MTIQLRWIRVDSDKVPGTTVPLAMIEPWRQTGMGYVKEMTQSAFYKLQAGIKNEATGNVEWSDVEIGTEPTTPVTRFIGGKAVRTAA